MLELDMKGTKTRSISDNLVTAPHDDAAGYWAVALMLCGFAGSLRLSSPNEAPRWPSLSIKQSTGLSYTQSWCSSFHVSCPPAPSRSDCARIRGGNSFHPP
jgi:hypothetical protein